MQTAQPAQQRARGLGFSPSVVGKVPAEPAKADAVLTTFLNSCANNRAPLWNSGRSARGIFYYSISDDRDHCDDGKFAMPFASVRRKIAM